MHPTERLGALEYSDSHGGGIDKLTAKGMNLQMQGQAILVFWNRAQL
jgi:hypothetical protein